MFSKWTYSQKAWFWLLAITSTPNFIRHMLLADKVRDVIAYGIMFIVFFALSMLGAWYFGKRIILSPRKK